MLDITTGIYRMFDGRYIDLSKVLEIGVPFYVARWEEHVALSVQFQLRDEPVVYRWYVGVNAERDADSRKLLWNDMPRVHPGEEKIWESICLERFAPIHAAMVDAWKEHRAWAIAAANLSRT